MHPCLNWENAPAPRGGRGEPGGTLRLSIQPGERASRGSPRPSGIRSEERDISGRALAAALAARKIVEWTLGYLAAAALLVQMTESLGDIWGLPLGLQQGITLALGLGVLPAGVVAWHHGERGPQRVTAGEIISVTVLVLLIGFAVWTACGPTPLLW